MRSRRLRKAIRVGAVLLGSLILLGGAGGLWLRSRLLGSLPRLDGSLALDGLIDTVRIERDALGVPTLRGTDRRDLARATGFVHAQDRFFQMDLLRRRGSGELAELFGPAVIDRDRAVRVHRFRPRARQIVNGLSPGDRAILDAYVEGVNAGLASLGTAPPEYLLLRVAPRPWATEDSLLVVFAMYIELQGGLWRREAALGLMHDVLPAQLVRFLVPRGTEWDAPMVGEAYATPAPPGPEIVDLRRGDRLGYRGSATAPPTLIQGSNNWAVSGAHTASGGALVANDMHLDLLLPNHWYRASLVLEGESRVTGATLPGAPVIVVGSNGHVAWGFTNSQGDWADLILVEPVSGVAADYRTPGGPATYTTHLERIAVRGEPEVELEVRDTIWGPILGDDPSGRPVALQWVAHDADGVNLGLLRMEHARDVDEAVAIARDCGIPAQNFVVGDAAGRIAWTLIGRLPRRVGFDGSVPTTRGDGAKRWDGWLESEHPVIRDPPQGRLWSANNRVADDRTLEHVGDGGVALGARARQIRDGLLAIERADERAMLGVQLDDRALFLERWRELLLDTLGRDRQGGPELAELRRVVSESWSGRASVDSVGYRMVRAFRIHVYRRVLDPLLAPCRRLDPNFRLPSHQFEGPLWNLVTHRPAHLLDPMHTDWNALLVDAAEATVEGFLHSGETALDPYTWGERNTLRIRHPMSLAVPTLSRWLDAPPRPLPGDANMPRVQAITAGASQRMVVTPGRESEGFFHMPGGQSGHFLSPFYLAGHDDWAEGRPSPFLPGPPVHTLRLDPP